MLFLLNGDGTMTRLDSGRIFQGSNNFTELGVIYPFSGVTLSVAFTLPNGIDTDYTPMPPLEPYTLRGNNGETKVFDNLYYTSTRIPATVTAMQGKVKVTVLATAAADVGGSANPTQGASFAATFTVEYAALPVYTVPDDPTEADFQKLVELLTAYQGTISGNVTELQNRMTTAEGNITSLGERVTTAEGEIDDLQGRMTAAEGNIEQAQGDISDLQSNKQDKTDNALKTPQKTVVGAINEIYDELTDTSGTGFASRLDTAEAEINVLESRVDDVEEKTKDPLMTDLTVDVATSTATKYYNNGTQADVTLPTGDTAERINFLTSAVFTDEQWAEQSDGTYALTLPASQTGRTNNKYVANLEVTDGSTQVVSADKLLKNEDGSITLKDFSEPWSGRVITVAAGQHGTVWHYGTAIVGTGTQTSTDLTLRASVLVGDFYLNTETSQCYVCAALPENASTWQYLANLQGAQGDKGDTGAPFAIYKTYVSVAAMNADAANVPDGAFVLIETGNVDDEDNSKLYVRTVGGAADFQFVTDLSGAQGIKGDNGTTFTPSVDTNGKLSWTNNGGLSNPTTVNVKGQKGDTGLAATIQIGTVTTLPAGGQATVENVGDEHNAVFDFALPQGAKGETGEANVVANPTSSPDSQLEKIEINGTIYNITRIINAVESVAQIYETTLAVGENINLPTNIESNLGDLIVVKFENLGAAGGKGVLFALNEGIGSGTCRLLAVISDTASGGGLTAQTYTFDGTMSLAQFRDTLEADGAANIVSIVPQRAVAGGIEITTNETTPRSFTLMAPTFTATVHGELIVEGMAVEGLGGGGNPTGIKPVQIIVMDSGSSNPMKDQLLLVDGIDFSWGVPECNAIPTANWQVTVYRNQA